MSQPKIVRLWIREDGERPCSIGIGGKPRGPGRVVDVEIVHGWRGLKNSDNARAVYELARAKVKRPKQGASLDELRAWAESEAARDAVKEVARG